MKVVQKQILHSVLEGRSKEKKESRGVGSVKKENKEKSKQQRGIRLETKGGRTDGGHGGDSKATKRKRSSKKAAEDRDYETHELIDKDEPAASSSSEESDESASFDVGDGSDPDSG